MEKGYYLGRLFPFDYEKEFNFLFEKTGSQTATLKPGFDRFNAKQFYDRKKIYDSATKFKYADGSTPKDIVEEYMNKGLTNLKILKYGQVKLYDENGVYVILGKKTKREADYVKMLYGVGNLFTHSDLD